jgi:hypothetical protein
MLSRPPGTSARSQASKNVVKHGADGFEISIDTMASQVPSMSRHRAAGYPRGA